MWSQGSDVWSLALRGCFTRCLELFVYNDHCLPWLQRNDHVVSNNVLMRCAVVRGIVWSLVVVHRSCLHSDHSVSWSGHNDLWALYFCGRYLWCVHRLPSKDQVKLWSEHSDFMVNHISHMGVITGHYILVVSTDGAFIGACCG